MKKLLALLFAVSLLGADTQPFASPPLAEQPLTPWLTGPLIAPTGEVVPFGSFELEAYAYATINTGAYTPSWHAVSAEHNFFSLNPQLLWFFGLTSWMDINVVPQFFYNMTNGQHSWNFGDLPVALDFQLMSVGYTPYFPGIKFTVRETFPTGPYQNLDPSKQLTDQSGAGTFGTTFNLVLYDVYHIKDHFFMSTTYSLAYTVTTPVHVHGFNTYGGGYGTEGYVLPGQTFQAIMSFEFALTQNWVIALDNVYTHVDATQFYGNPGTQLPGGRGGAASVGASSSEQISFAPAIEYNFGSNFGICAGCWFSAWGRNSTRFVSGVVEFVYTY